MERSSFFHSINGDRKYKASDFAEYFNALLTNGVFPNPVTNLQGISNNNMTITIKAGKAWIHGYCYINDSDLILPIMVADGVLNRIDRVVLKMDTVGRNITAQVKKGTFASSPVAPALQRDADAYELGIADIYIGKGVTSIAQANITDLRMNISLCGWVNSLIQADTTAIFNQYMDWFNTKTGQYNTEMANKEIDFTNQFTAWFDGVKNTLGADIAGNLLNQINGLAGAGRTTETVKKNADDIAALGSSLAESVSKTMITAANDFIVGAGNGVVAKKTLAETKSILGISSVASATETVQGIVELATTAEVTAGTDTTRVVTPKGLKDQGYFNQANYGKVEYTGGNSTLALFQANWVLHASSNVTIPSNAMVTFPIGTQITFIQNSGLVTFIPSSGVTLNSKDSKRSIDGLYASATLIKTAIDTWYLIGALK